jgi:hypothetical protein
VDAYYRIHRTLPRPAVAHQEIEICRKDSVLVVGDVHGCLEELLELVDRAAVAYDSDEEEGKGKEGNGCVYVVLVGDLVNKGPRSADVVRLVRTMKKRDGWLCVRGNHDDGALLAAVGDERRKSKRRYDWVDDLSDEDVVWLSELPYTIRIRCKDCDDDQDDPTTIVVHAGLVPGVKLEDQTAQDMITLRNVVVVNAGAEAGFGRRYISENDPLVSDQENRELVAWASAWTGPGHVVFGHDARRGLQLHAHATGLDTGCCYGKHLSGIVLPSRRLV